MPSIGNDLFRNWLKELAPVARTQQMGEIAKTQAAKGLHGSAIKASLAQLAQPCRVMLVPLTHKEITYHTRRSEKNSHGTQKKQSNSSTSKLNNVKPKSKPKKQKPISSEYLSLSNKVSKSTNTQGSTEPPNKTANEKLKRKLEELFGNDPDESHFKANQTTDIQNSTNVNYVSTTLHVNIYTNGTPANSSNSKTILKRKSSEVERSKRKNPPKKLRIDVSLPNNEMCSDDNVNYADIQFSKDGIENTLIKKKTQKRSSSKNKAKRSKPKIAIPSVLPTNTGEEDASIKELWSILGMESPTDRSESIKNSESVKLATNPLDVGETRCESQPLDQTENDGDSGAVCQISETFSLAHLSTSTFNLKNVEENPDAKVSDEVSCQKDCSEPRETNKVGKIRVKSIDSLMNPASYVNGPIDETQLKCTSSNSPDDNALSSFFQANTLSSSATIEPSTLQNDVDPNCGLGDTEESKKCFFTTYRFYFNDLVESKIPKLGEILHLAIGDEIRRKERIAAATQLSSQHFVLEEKQRACNDFRELMKLRGEEFAPPFCSIFQGFEENSQVTLFFALLYRVLKSAIQIDSRHEHCVLEANSAILAMLSFGSIENSNIITILKSDFNEFVEQLKIISQLVDEYYLVNTIERQLDSSTRSRKTTVASNNVVYRETSNVATGRNSVNAAQKSAMQRNLVFSSNTNLVPMVRQQVANMNITPSSPQSRRNVTEAQNHLSSSKTKTMVISNLKTVNKDVQSSAQNNPQSSSNSLHSTKLSINQANSAVQNPSVLPSSKSGDPKAFSTPSKTFVQRRQSQIARNNHDTTTATDPIVVRSINKQNNEVIPKEVTPSNRNPNVILRMPLNSLQISSSPVNHAPQLTLVRGIPDNPTAYSFHRTLTNDGKNAAFDGKPPNLNQTLISPIRSTTSTVNNSRTYQKSTTVNSASSVTSSDKCAVPGLLDVRPRELNCKDPVNSVNVQSQVVPSSSHCHPFVKRMPISGKMRMFFDHN